MMKNSKLRDHEFDIIAVNYYNNWNIQYFILKLNGIILLHITNHKYYLQILNSHHKKKCDICISLEMVLD